MLYNLSLEQQFDYLLKCAGVKLISGRASCRPNWGCDLMGTACPHKWWWYDSPPGLCWVCYCLALSHYLESFSVCQLSFSIGGGTTWLGGGKYWLSGLVLFYFILFYFISFLFTLFWYYIVRCQIRFAFTSWLRWGCYYLALSDYLNSIGVAIGAIALGGGGVHLLRRGQVLAFGQGTLGVPPILSGGMGALFNYFLSVSN